MQYRCRHFFLDSVLFLFFVTSLVQGQGTCHQRRFQCANAKCIPDNWQCDGEDDCGDASDERDCEERSCRDTEFECHSRDQCIPLRWRCDGDRDCYDGSDENCTARTCPTDYFSCADEESPCIPNTWVCDYEADCDSGLDEASCNLLTCPPEEFKCHDDSQCISSMWVCDHDHDCADGSDEAECPDTTCATDNFMCNAATRDCIPESWRCDGDMECDDGSDESGCATNGETQVCVPGLFQCNNGDCIHESWTCDREDDCGDNSDEDRSICPEATCPPYQYTCENGHCLPGDSRCNDRNDCEDGSDEMGCPTPPVVVPPGATSPSPMYIPENQCAVGYRYTEAGCVDVDECLDTIYPVCSHECINTEGSFRCHCQRNYRLVNHTYCKALGDHPWIVYNYDNGIRKFYPVTLENLEIYRDLPNPLAFDVDYRSGLVFWSDSTESKIMKGSFDGSTTPQPIVEGIGIVDGIAYDWIYRNIYWTDTHVNMIKVASVDTLRSRVLFSEDLDEPRAIVVDPRHGYIYWTDWGAEPKLEKAAMDGSSREVIFHQGKTMIEWPNGLTIDYNRDRLYWVDAKHHMLMSSDLSGEDFHVVLRDAMVLQHPFQLAVFQDEIYWTDWGTNSIRRVNKFTGGNVTDVVQQHFQSSPIGLKIWQENTQPAAYSRNSFWIWIILFLLILFLIILAGIFIHRRSTTHQGRGPRDKQEKTSDSGKIQMRDRCDLQPEDNMKIIYYQHENAYV